MQSRSVGLVGILIACVIIAGCGGDDNEATGAGSAPAAASDDSSAGEGEGILRELASEPEPSEKEKFIDWANGACERAIRDISAAMNTAISNIRDEPEKKKNAVRARIIKDVFVPRMRAEAWEIGAFVLTPEDEERIHAIVEAVEDMAEDAERKPESFVGKKPKSFLTAERLANEYGLDKCPQG